MLRLSTVEREGILVVARYRHLDLLLSSEELQRMVEACGPLIRYSAGAPVSRVESQEGVEVPAYWTADEEALYAIALPDNRSLVRATHPVVEARPWKGALRLSYPHLYQIGDEILKVDPKSPNSQLFRRLQRWVRHETVRLK